MTGRLLRSKRRRKPKRFFRRAPRFRRGRSIAIRRLFYFSDSVPIRFGDFRAFASERAMSGGEAACARFPVEHSWFLNRARRRLWAREWLSPLCKTLAGLRNLATETARDRRPVLRTALERAERVLERDTHLCGYAVRRLFGELTCAVVPPPPAIGAEPRTVA